MASEYFVYCSKCGFYPGGYDVSVGITVEDHAANLADLHSGGVHQAFVIPSHWITPSLDKKDQTKYSTGISGIDADMETHVTDTRI